MSKVKGIEDLVKKKRKLKSKKKKKKYVEGRCEYIRRSGKQCKRNAVGKGTLCKKHGGKISKDLLIPEDSANLLSYSKYNPDYHPFEILRLAQQGLSPVEIAAQFVIGVKTLKSWSEKYENFSIAYEVAQAMHESHYLGVAKRNLTNPMFQTALFKFLAANKLGYADKVESKNLNVNTQVGVLRVPGRMSMDEWKNADFTQAPEETAKKIKSD